MANYPIKENPELNLIARMFETTDRGHADVFNALGELLINNDAFLNAAVNKMIEKGMITHVLGSSSTEQVLGADVGPKITELINAVDNKVAKVNSDLEYKTIAYGDIRALSTGRYYCLNNATNLPISTTSFVNVKDADNDGRKFIEVTPVGSNIKYVSNLRDGVWSSWDKYVLISDLDAYLNVITNVYANHDVYTQVKARVESGKRCGIMYFTNATNFPETITNKTGYIDYFNHNQTNFIALRCYVNGQKPVDGQMALNATGITWYT